MRLPLGSVHDSPPKDTLQLFGVWWGNGVATDGQLHQGQAHAPHVGLNGVVSALQSLRLLRNTQPTSAGGRQSQDARQRERGRERVLRGGLGEREAQEAEERIKARGGGVLWQGAFGCGEGKRMGGLGRRREAVTHCFCSDVTEGQVCVGICAKKCCCCFFF